ncbi:MAG: hypothetical protein OXI90_07450 [Gammaproteobacteria bacterium]|nr:hypothetical protein [Gammaproteobacteria bacterium]
MSQESEDRSDRPRWYGFAQLAGVVVLIAVALYFARAPDRVERQSVPDSEAAGGTPVVNVIQPAPTAEALSLRLTGAVRLERRASVVSEVTGRVVWISPNFSSGGSIAANEDILRIDPTEFQLRVEAAEAAAAVAREISATAVGGANAALKLAQLSLNRTSISFPYDSRVLNADVEVGELVGPPDDVGRDASLGVIYRAEALQAEVPIELADLERLSPAIGRSARLHVGPDTFEAEVVRVSWMVAPKTRLATLFLRFSGEVPVSSLPLPGNFVVAEIMGPMQKNVFVLPESALREGDSVWVVEDGSLVVRQTGVLGRVGADWVTNAFDAGQGIVVGTVPGARPGMAVAVSAEASSA